jgi:hypothetical protein
MKFLISAAFALACLALGDFVSAQSTRHFFPMRPTHAVLHGENGVLTAFGIGNDTAGVALHLSDGRTDKFYLAFPHTFNGKLAHCRQVAEPSIAPGFTECKEQLPANIIVGKTRVRITYWWTTYNGTPVKVADTLAADP